MLVVLAVFALPFTRVQFGGFDERVMPADTPARIVSEVLRDDFPGGGVTPINVFVPDGTAAVRLVPRIPALPDVTGARGD